MSRIFRRRRNRQSQLSKTSRAFVALHLTASTVYTASSVSFVTAASYPDELFEYQQRGEAQLSRKFLPRRSAANNTLCELRAPVPRERAFFFVSAQSQCQRPQRIDIRRSHRSCHQPGDRRTSVARAGHVARQRMSGYGESQERHSPNECARPPLPTSLCPPRS
ncbi:hypothetical protein FIV00_03265 [Labrenzia sp. THAF82]|nr:hypothetical protein FIV00_03265 [Labrenzia sp. THAF82]